MGNLKKRVFGLTVLISMSTVMQAQPKLKIVFTRLGFLKKYEILQNDVIRYKLKGEREFVTGKILALKDSSIIFEADSVGLNQIKMIRIKNENYHSKLFQKLFLVGGIGYPFLTVVNNSLNQVNPILSEKSAIVSASFLMASFIIYRSRIKRIRFTEDKLIKIENIDYENINIRE